MALVSLPRYLLYPGLTHYFAGTPALGTAVTLDASGEYHAIVIMANQDMTVSHVAFKHGVTSGTTRALDISLQSVNATTGLPSGTVLGATNNGKVTTGTLGTSAAWPTVLALTESVSITKGQIFALVFTWAATNTAADSIILQNISRVNNAQSSLPYLASDTGAGAAKANTAASAILAALGSNSTTFYNVPALYPLTTFNSSTFNNTNSAKRGARFQVPFKCRCAGVSFRASTTGGDFNVLIENDAGTEQSSSSTAVDGNLTGETSTGTSQCFFDNGVSLDINTWYRAVIQPTSATNVTLDTLSLPSADYRSGMPGGTNWHYATFASGSWTDSATDTVPLLDIIIDQLDDGASAGGALLRNPGMNGGFA